jgi:cytoskeletal protein RodZ
MQVRKLIPLERAQALAVIRDVGVALAYAHSRGVAHGDLNLRNIFITGAGELRVLGFGGAHKSRQISGTTDHETLPFAASAYASCQVLEGERPDARDDVFALACIAYLLLSGDHPFSKKTAVDARDSGLRLRRPASLSGRQWHALRAALQWERERRPADVEAWLSQLDLRGAAKRAAPLADFLEPPLRRASRRPGGPATAIAAGVALLLAGAYWMLTHRATLPRIDSTTQVRVPDTPAQPPSTSDRGQHPIVSAPAPQARNPAPAAAPVQRGAAAPETASQRKAAPPAPTAANRQPTVNQQAPPVAAPPVTAQPAAPAQRAVAPPVAAAQRATAAPVAAPAAAPAGASKLELAADTVEVGTSEPSAQVTVHRKGNLRGSTSFTWWTESGTAKPGADFSAVVPQLAYFGDGKSTVSLSIPVSGGRHAQPKSFYVVIDQSEGGAPVGGRTLTMVTLLPND